MEVGDLFGRFNGADGLLEFGFDLPHSFEIHLEILWGEIGELCCIDDEYCPLRARDERLILLAWPGSRWC